MLHPAGTGPDQNSTNGCCNCHLSFHSSKSPLAAYIFLNNIPAQLRRLLNYRYETMRAFGIECLTIGKERFLSPISWVHSVSSSVVSLIPGCEWCIVVLYCAYVASYFRLANAKNQFIVHRSETTKAKTTNERTTKASDRCSDSPDWLYEWNNQLSVLGFFRWAKHRKRRFLKHMRNRFRIFQWVRIIIIQPVKKGEDSSHNSNLDQPRAQSWRWRTKQMNGNDLEENCTV